MITLPGLLLFIFLSPSVPPAPPLRVIKTTGSTSEAVCLVADGESLWVGTRGGVLLHGPGLTRRFDASDGLPGNRISDCILHGARLWVATEAGLSVFSAQEQRFHAVLPGRFLRLASTGEQLLAALDDGRLLHLRAAGETVTRLGMDRLEAPPLSLVGLPGGGYAAGMANGQVHLSDGVSLDLGIPVTDLAVDRTDSLLALTPGRGWRIFEGQATRAPELDEAAALLEDGVPVTWPGAALVHDSARWAGQVALATDEGLQVRSRDDGDWTRLGTDALPCGPRLSALAVHRGELWVGGFDSGVCRLHEGRWIQYRGPRHLPSDMVNHMASTPRGLIIATLSGVAVVGRDGAFSQMTHEDCVDDTRRACPWHASVTGVAVDPATGRTWVADTGAVHKVRSKRWTHYFRRAGISSSRITRIAARGGRIALGTVDQGVLLKDGHGRFHGMNDRGGIPDNWIMDLVWDRAGALWVGTCTRGLARWDGASWMTWTTAEGLSDDYILSVQELDGLIWVGTLRGLTLLSPRGATRFTTRDGLAGDEVHDVVAMGTEIYLATDGGLTILTRQPAPAPLPSS